MNTTLQSFFLPDDTRWSIGMDSSEVEEKKLG